MAKTMSRRGKRTGDDKRVYHFVRGATADLTPASTDIGRAAFITLSGLSNISEITNLFDEYKIEWEEFTVHFTGFTNNALTNYEGFYPWIITALDYNDSTVPITANELLEYKNSEYFQFGPANLTYTRRWVPRASVNATSGTALIDSETWATTATTSLPWLGMKYFIGGFNSVDRNHTARFTYRCGISCRVPK